MARNRQFFGSRSLKPAVLEWLLKSLLTFCFLLPNFLLLTFLSCKVYFFQPRPAISITFRKRIICIWGILKIFDNRRFVPILLFRTLSKSLILPLTYSINSLNVLLIYWLLNIWEWLLVDY